MAGFAIHATIDETAFEALRAEAKSRNVPLHTYIKSLLETYAKGKVKDNAKSKTSK